MATFLAIWWLRLRVPRVGGLGLIPGQGTKILRAAWCDHKTKPKTPRNQVNQGVMSLIED